MSNDLITQTFGVHAIRIATLGDQPWFVAADVGRALEMDMSSGVNRYLKAVSLDERRKVTRRELPHLFRGSHAPSMLVISESGLYKLIMRSNKPEAKAFQDWVTRHVLPAIRKDGMYVRGEEKVAVGEMSEDEFVLKAFTLLQAKVERLTAENTHLRQELDHLTVDEFRALKHAYWSKAFKSMIGRTASGIYRGRGLSPAKQIRVYRDREGLEQTIEVNVYDRPVLEEALAKVGRMAAAH